MGVGVRHVPGCRYGRVDGGPDCHHRSFCRRCSWPSSLSASPCSWRASKAAPPTTAVAPPELHKSGRAGDISAARPSIAPSHLRVEYLLASLTPAAHPGARPPLGGDSSAGGAPLTLKSQDTNELKFHMSPVGATTRPQVRTGICGRCRSSDCAVASFFATVIGPPTAHPKSGMKPSRQHRTSYRKNQDRPRTQRPTGPLTTIP